MLLHCQQKNPHAIPDENDILNVPNLEKQITQLQPHLQPHVIETEVSTVLDSTTGYMLEYRQLEKGPDQEI